MFSTIRYRWKTCRVFDKSHDENDNIIVGKEAAYDIKVGFLNMNSLAADCKIEYILWYYECLQLDVLFLSDIRLSKLQVDLFKQRAHSRLGADTKIFSSLSKKSLDKKCNVGGQIVIVRPTWAQHVVKAQGDHTGLGLVMEIDIKLKDSKLKILGNYCPSRSNAENGLWSAVRDLMQQETQSVTMSNN